MKLYNIFKGFLKIKSLILCLTVVCLVACDFGANDNNDYSDSNSKLTFEDLNEELNLASGSQLFSLKKGSDSDTSKLLSIAQASIKDEGNSIDGLVILDAQGKGKRFLKDVKINRLHLISDGQKSAYLARVDKDHAFKLDLKNPWIIIKEGKKGIPIKPKRTDIWSSGSEFVGQTESAGYLVFKDGELVNLDGDQLSYSLFGKGVGDVVQADYVSGDIISIVRDVAGNRVSSILDLVNKKRKSYSDPFTPKFVEIAPGKGLICDTTKRPPPGDSNITKLEEEINESSTDRAIPLKEADIGRCTWFYGSTRIATNNAAILVCAVKPRPTTSSYRLRWVELNPAGGFKIEKIAELSNKDETLTSSSNSNFINGDGFTVMRVGNDFLLISHATKNTIKVTPTLQTVFDIRINVDKKSFSVLGEDNDGEIYLEGYNSDGTVRGKVTVKVD